MAKTLLAGITLAVAGMHGAIAREHPRRMRHILGIIEHRHARVACSRR